MCRTGIVGMTSWNEIKVKFAFDLRRLVWWYEKYVRLGTKLQEMVFIRGFVNVWISIQ